MLKRLRNAVISNKPAQTTIRYAARTGVMPASIYRRLPPLGEHPVTSPAGHSFTYVASLDDMMSRQVVWENLSVWEANSLKAFSSFAAESELFLDIGAYSGIYSLIACVDGPGHAIAFEPNPSARPLLERNIEANDFQERISIIAKGASDVAGEARMIVPEDRTAARIDESGAGPVVEVTTIDKVLNGRKVDIIRIDVEGLEPRVLLGGIQTIRRHTPVLILECLDDEVFQELVAILRPLGYDRCIHLGPIPRSTQQRIHMPGHANYLWTHGGETVLEAV